MRTTLLLSVACLLALSACTGTSTRADLPGATPLRAAVIPYPGYTHLVVADAMGFFERHGVDVEVDVIADLSQATAALAANAVQMTVSTPDYSVVMADGGVDAVQFYATDIGYGADGLLAAGDVRSIADVRGKTVHLGLGYPSHFFFRYVAEKAGIAADEVRLERMEPDQVGAAFAAGQIDLGVTWEPWLTNGLKQRPDARAVVTSRDEPGIIVDTIVVRSDVAAARPADVRAVVRALLDAEEFRRAEPERYAAIGAEAFGIPLEEFKAQLETVRFLDLEGNRRVFDPASERSLHELTREAVRIYRQDGVVSADVDPASVVDGRFVSDPAAE